jgi:hypothetical protein
MRPDDARARALAAPLLGRRDFLFGGGIALASLLLIRPNLAVTHALRDIHLPKIGGAAPPLSLGTFAPHIGSTFTVPSEDFGLVSLMLLEAVAARSHANQPTLIGGEAFSLLFEGSTATRLAAGQHRLTHGSLAPVSLHLFPVGRGSNVQDYQTVIDQRRFNSGPAPKKAA